MLPESLQKMIGLTSEEFRLEVDRSSIRRYADAVGDRNPLYWDEEYANHSKYGSLIAPPGFFGWPVQWDNAMPFFSGLKGELIETLGKEGFSTILDGGIEYEFLEPVRLGDSFSSVSQIVEIKLKESTNRTMIFSVIETKYCNQNDYVSAVTRQTLIAR